LAQGRQKAEDAFVRRDDVVQLFEERVEQDIVSIGNRAAAALLEARIADHKAVLSKMPVDYELRRQYQKEIRALEAKQRQLGHMGPDLDVLITPWDGRSGGDQTGKKASEAFGAHPTWFG
jgi:hypothetical protein